MKWKDQFLVHKTFKIGKEKITFRSRKIWRVWKRAEGGKNTRKLFFHPAQKTFLKKCQTCQVTSDIKAKKLFSLTHQRQVLGGHHLPLRFLLCVRCRKRDVVHPLRPFPVLTVVKQFQHSFLLTPDLLQPTIKADYRGGNVLRSESARRNQFTRVFSCKGVIESAFCLTASV